MMEKQIELFIIDRDPIFRLGLCTALSYYEDFQVVIQEKDTEDIFRQLEEGFMPDLILIEWDFPEQEDSRLNPLLFCQELQQEYPQIPLFLLAANWNKTEVAKAKALGIRGFCLKGLNIENLIYGLRKVAAGETYWQETNLPEDDPNLLQQAFAGLSRPGAETIESDLSELEQLLDSKGLSILKRILLSGRKRELSSARWLIKRLSGESGQKIPDLPKVDPQVSKALPEAKKTELLPPPQIAIATINTDSVTAKVFNRLLNDISQGINNQTDIWLEIDILLPQSKQRLFYLIVENLEKAIFEFSKDQDLILQTEQSLYEIWQRSTCNFFFQNYQDSLDIDYDTLLDLCDREYRFIKQSIFSRIYFAQELLAYLSWEESLTINFVSYRAESPEATMRAVNLLHNLVIQTANGVMAVILNYFSDLDIFKYQLFDPKYNNSRKIARFRNEISWRYRQEQYWFIPRNIFESCYQLLVLRGGKIKQYQITAPRDQELDQLEGLAWTTTIALELRDALAPRLRSLIALVGNGLVFTLTQVVGKGIGLITKGIIQGINSTIRDQNKRR